MSLVTGGAGHYHHVTGGELQSQRERERECVCVWSLLRIAASLLLWIYALGIVVVNYLVAFVSRIVSRFVCQIVSAFCSKFAYRFLIVLDFFVFFLDLSCVVLCRVFSFFHFLIRASSASSSSSVTFSSCVVPECFLEALRTISRLRVLLLPTEHMFADCLHRSIFRNNTRSFRLRSCANKGDHQRWVCSFIFNYSQGPGGSSFVFRITGSNG